MAIWSLKGKKDACVDLTRLLMLTGSLRRSVHRVIVSDVFLELGLNRTGILLQTLAVAFHWFECEYWPKTTYPHPLDRKYLAWYLRKVG